MAATAEQLQRFRGSMTALITPFKGDAVDADAYQALCKRQIDAGTSVLVPVGTTGESPTLTHEEHRRVVELAIEAARGTKTLVMAGAGANSTAEAIALTQHAAKAGADAVLTVVPYYNKPTQEGMYLHYKAIHDSAEIPIVIYNIPARSVVDMSPATMARLAQLPRIMGVKDATADLVRPLKTLEAIGRNFVQLSGEDATALPFRVQGGIGCISVTSNVAPGPLAEMHAAWEAGDWAKATEINERFFPLHDALFCETSPAPVKYAASLLGYCAPDCRLPLAPMSDEGKKRVRTAMEKAGIL